LPPDREFRDKVLGLAAGCPITIRGRIDPAIASRAVFFPDGIVGQNFSCPLLGQAKQENDQNPILPIL